MDWINQHSAGLQAGASLLASLAALIAIIVTLRSSNKQLLATIRTAEHQLTTNVKIAERQLKATVLSANRQAWINKLRSEIASALSCLLGMHHMVLVESSQEERAAIADKLDLNIATISLLLNLNEEDHRNLMRALQNIPKTIVDFVKSGKADPTGTGDLVTEITFLSQGILKREWERVKALD
jgi:hypothetical protein